MDKDQMSRKLLTWFRRHKRDMPWRNTRDPYAIWVSEIMLQQTRVSAVTPYYLRFLKRFPTVESLAAAEQSEVLKLWEGLGYYSRGRNLHKAAGILVRDFDGQLPQTTKALMTLPGIGRYSAGAIGSIAFGLDEPVLDGNVTRVLCRVFRIRTDPKASTTQKKLWKLAGQLLPANQAADFNQAIMEFGARVCTPKNPKCLQCPLGEGCLAKHFDETATIPLRKLKAPIPHRTIVAGVIRRGEKILIDRRKPDAMLGGLWEFPGGGVEEGESLEEALRREVREEIGIEIRVDEKLTTVQHAYSHFRITLHAFSCRHRSGRSRALECDEIKWVLPEQLRQYAFPKANHKILDLLTE